MTRINHRTAEQVVHRLLAHPEWSNPRVAAPVGCDPRCVRRYRKLLAAKGLTAADLAGLDAVSIWALFNERAPVHPEDSLGFDGPDALPAGASAAARWRLYRDRQVAQGRPVLSQRQYVRRWRAHVGTGGAP